MLMVGEVVGGGVVGDCVGTRVGDVVMSPAFLYQVGAPRDASVSGPPSSHALQLVPACAWIGAVCEGDGGPWLTYLIMTVPVPLLGWPLPSSKYPP